jgi:hypothetical protein
MCIAVSFLRLYTIRLQFYVDLTKPIIGIWPSYIPSYYESSLVFTIWILSSSSLD